MSGDFYRVQGSALLSTSFHGLAFGLYLLLRTAEGAQQLRLTEVEFLDARPEPVQELPGGRLPRGIKDLLRMALPKLDEPAVQDAQPLEAPRDTDIAPAPLPTPKAIKLDESKLLARGAPITLSKAAPAKSAGAAFADVSPQADASLDPAPDLAEAPEPSLNLEAVGRKAARAGSPSIRIEPGAAVARRASLAEVAVAPSRHSAGATLGTEVPEPGIQIAEGSGPRRGSAGPAPELPVSYRRGGAISLKTRPSERPAGLPLSAVGAGAAAPAAPKLETNLGRGKSVEISGPLAQRKIVSMTLPSYPEWAKAKGVEAEVVIRFFVSAEGRVRDRLILERTSGYPELDELSMEAIKKWIFVTLEKGKDQADQWGIITFRFRLK